jgi:hypothetical protein
MIGDDHLDVVDEAIRSAAKDTVAIASILTALIRAGLDFKARVERLRVERDEQARKDQQAQLDAERAATRARYAPGNDSAWLRDAGLLEVARVWGAAVPFADRGSELFEESAESAVLNCEIRLRDLHPYAMSRYDRLRADGMEPAEAMYEALPLFARPVHAYEQTARARSALDAGDACGYQWAAAEHGPTRIGMEDWRQQQRGAQILEQAQARAIRDGGVPFGVSEQRVMLETTTSLTPRQIAATVRTAPSASAPRRPWREDFPFPIRDVLAVATAAKQRGQGAPASHVSPGQPEARPSRR